MFSGGNNNVLCPPDDVVSCMGPSNDINITRILVLSYICSMNCPRDLSSATLYNNHPFLGRRPPLHLLLLHTFTSQPAECRTFLICRREEEGQSMEWQRKHSKVSGQEVFCHQDGTLAGVETGRINEEEEDNLLIHTSLTRSLIDSISNCISVAWHPVSQPLKHVALTRTKNEPAAGASNPEQRPNFTYWKAIGGIELNQFKEHFYYHDHVGRTAVIALFYFIYLERGSLFKV